MKTRTIVVLVVAAAAAIAAVSLWRQPLPIGGIENGAPDSRASSAPAPASASTPSATNSGDAAADLRGTDAAWRTPSTPSPRYAEPEEIERQLGQFLAQQPGLEVVSLSSIDCGATTCEIALTGSDPNPRYVDAYHDLYEKLNGAGGNDFVIGPAASVRASSHRALAST